MPDSEILHEIHTSVKLIEQRQEGLIKRIDKHDSTLYGNGKTGVCERLGVVERIVYILSGGAILIAIALIGIKVK
jgi:hypothetical protein